MSIPNDLNTLLLPASTSGEESSVSHVTSISESDYPIFRVSSFKDLFETFKRLLESTEKYEKIAFESTEGGYERLLSKPEIDVREQLQNFMLRPIKKFEIIDLTRISNFKAEYLTFIAFFCEKVFVKVLCVQSNEGVRIIESTQQQLKSLHTLVYKNRNKRGENLTKFGVPLPIIDHTRISITTLIIENLPVRLTNFTDAIYIKKITHKSRFTVVKFKEKEKNCTQKVMNCIKSLFYFKCR